MPTDEFGFPTGDTGTAPPPPGGGSSANYRTEFIPGTNRYYVVYTDANGLEQRDGPYTQAEGSTGPAAPKPQGALSTTDLQGIGGKISGATATVTQKDGSVDRYVQNPDKTWDYRSTTAAPKAADSKLTGIEAATAFIGGLRNAGAGASVPFAPTTPGTGTATTGNSPATATFADTRRFVNPGSDEVTSEPTSGSSRYIPSSVAPGQEAQFAQTGVARTSEGYPIRNGVVFAPGVPLNRTTLGFDPQAINETARIGTYDPFTRRTTYGFADDPEKNARSAAEFMGLRDFVSGVRPDLSASQVQAIASIFAAGKPPDFFYNPVDQEEQARLEALAKSLAAAPASQDDQNNVEFAATGRDFMATEPTFASFRGLRSGRSRNVVLGEAGPEPVSIGPTPGFADAAPTQFAEPTAYDILAGEVARRRGSIMTAPGGGFLVRLPGGSNYVFDPVLDRSTQFDNYFGKEVPSATFGRTFFSPRSAGFADLFGGFAGALAPAPKESQQQGGQRGPATNTGQQGVGNLLSPRGQQAYSLLRGSY